MYTGNVKRHVSSDVKLMRRIRDVNCQFEICMSLL